MSEIVESGPSDWKLPEKARERLRQKVLEWGTVAQVADVTHMPRPTLAKILNGSGDVGISRIKAICDAINVSVEWVLLGKSTSQFDGQDIVSVMEIDLSYGLGASWIDGVPVTETVRQFPVDWVRQFTHSPAAKLFFARGSGDSMMPTIQDGDVVLVDTDQKTPTIADRIWVLSWGGMGMIKRLRGQPDGGMRLISDNPVVPPEVAYDGELSVIGRVVAIVRKM